MEAKGFLYDSFVFVFVLLFFTENLGYKGLYLNTQEAKAEGSLLLGEWLQGQLQQLSGTLSQVSKKKTGIIAQL